MTLGLARTFAPSFGKVERKVLADGTVETTKLSGIRSIGHASLTSKIEPCARSLDVLVCSGFGVIYESCENAAKHLATNLANESVSVVKHK